MEKRKAFIKKILTWAAVLLVYYIFVRITGLSLPCMFHEITGLKCPGCGITHMLLNAAKLDFTQALACNAVLFFMLPFFGVLILIKIIFMPKWLEGTNPVFNGIMIACCAVLIVFGIVRNII
jgi:hypothetical protein